MIHPSRRTSVPHEIETMAYFGATPWHRLGAALDETDLYDWPSASKKANLDWEVELVPLVAADTNAQVAHRAVRRTSDSKVVGVVGPRYALLQNRDAFAWFQPFLDAREAALHTAGSLKSGSRVWVLAKLNRDPLLIAEGDEVEKYRFFRGKVRNLRLLALSLAAALRYPARRVPPG
jgi:hypothetical protein